MTTGMLKVVAPPQITTPPQSQSVTEGMFVELVCETAGMPEPQVNESQIILRQLMDIIETVLSQYR